jgi:hypothetical protein
MVPLVADEIASVDFVVTNPPFMLALEFIRSATARLAVGFAMLVRSAFLEGADRYQQLWSVFPPAYELQFAERVVMLEGRLVAPARRPVRRKAGTKASTATSLCLAGLAGRAVRHAQALDWPVPQRLERPGDYPTCLPVAPEIQPGGTADDA